MFIAHTVFRGTTFPVLCYHKLSMQVRDYWRKNPSQYPKLLKGLNVVASCSIVKSFFGRSSKKLPVRENVQQTQLRCSCGWDTNFLAMPLLQVQFTKPCLSSASLSVRNCQTLFSVQITKLK